ncbi:MAG: Biopolymer transport protein ExbD [Syntrophorhabdus sp. PtaU1.Bin050]|jgi:biopolymer transport protein ExbD|nr:MAG: Biopolymer transport protein ExbD [Syntrophorhabdus sp. PtaU1.Bin050]
MKLPRKHGKKKARIEIIPMIDTMFFLLVFFMVASLSMTVQRGLPVNLPHAASARDEVKQVITLTVTKGGRLFVDNDEVSSSAEVAARLADRRKADVELAVLIKADRSAEHGRVVDLMDAVRQVGVSRIAVGVTANVP